MVVRRLMLGALLAVPAVASAHGPQGHCGRRGGPGHALPNGRCEATYPAARAAKNGQQTSLGGSTRKSKPNSSVGNERTPAHALSPKNSSALR